MPEIRNPNLQPQGSGGGSGGDMRCTMASALLLLVVLLGYQYFFKPKPQRRPLPQTKPSRRPAAGRSNSRVQPASRSSRRRPALPQAPAATPADRRRAGNRDHGRKREVQDRLHQSRRAGEALDPEESTTTPAQAASRWIWSSPRRRHFGLPLSLFTYEPALTTQLNQALSIRSRSRRAASATGTLMAPARSPSATPPTALEVVKTFRFDSSYVISVETQVKRNGLPVRALVQWPGGWATWRSSCIPSQYRHPTHALQFCLVPRRQAGSTDATKVSGNATLDQPYDYAAISDLYFAAAFLPDDPARHDGGHAAQHHRAAQRS